MRILIFYFALFSFFSSKIQLMSTEFDNSANILINEPNCLLFYTRGVTVKLNHHVVQLNNSKIVNNTFCHNKTAGIEIIEKLNSHSISRIELKFNFIETYFGWEMNGLNLSINCSENSVNCTELYKVQMLSSTVIAPHKMSYHCTKQIFTAKNGSHINVLFDKIQIQPFVLNVTKFDSANDCIGFFSEGSWTVLLVSVVLVGILSFGIQMILNIQTSDKFDNPKGCQINIAGSE